MVDTRKPDTEFNDISQMGRGFFVYVRSPVRMSDVSARVSAPDAAGLFFVCLSRVDISGDYPIRIRGSPPRLPILIARRLLKQCDY